jgi:hypothetical protein
MIPAARAASEGGGMIPPDCLAMTAGDAAAWWAAGDLLRSRWLFLGILMLTCVLKQEITDVII